MRLRKAKSKNSPGRGNSRAALSVQQTIPYLAMHPDGVCKLPGGLYTKTVEYEDINYSVASTEDQTAIFGGWSSFLNYFDSTLPFQLSFKTVAGAQPPSFFRKEARLSLQPISGLTR